MNKILRNTAKLAYKNGRRCEVLTLRANTCGPVTPPLTGDVPGLSKKVVDVPAHEVGAPKASKEACYKNPEYFCYHNLSFFEAEIEMMQYRLPQPSNKPVKN